MNRNEKSQKLQTQMYNWFADWANFANDKAKIGARVKPINHGIELLIKMKTRVPFIAQITYDVCFYSGKVSLKLISSKDYDFAQELHTLLAGIRSGNSDEMYFNHEHYVMEMELVDDDFINDFSAIKNKIGYKVKAFFENKNGMMNLELP